MAMRLFAIIYFCMFFYFTMGKPTNRRYCGEQLNAVLSKFCENKFETYMRNLNEDFGHSDSDEVQPSKPKWYIKGGVADECCINPCSIDTLASYCSSTYMDSRKNNGNNSVRK